MTRRTRKLLAVAVLLLGLPGYVIVAVTVVGLFERPPFVVEVAIYLGLGVLWAFPLRRLFLGLGRPDPDANGERPPHGRER